MKIHILGQTGMLGRYTYTHFKREGYDVVGYTRNDIDAAEINEPQLRAKLFHLGVKKDDVIINCVGTIKPQIDKLGTLNAIQVNSIFPHILANVCEIEKYKLIHITTDCVFSGNEGNYTEKHLHDCTDVYGKTKSLGEPPNCTVVRTSIIGEEIGTSRSLIEWVKSEDGNNINGYTNHFWNGVSCHQMAKIFEQIIRENKYWKGVRHIFSPRSISKHELLENIIQVHRLNIIVKPVFAPTRCDRTLSTNISSDSFDIPDIITQLEEQYNF